MWSGEKGQMGNIGWIELLIIMGVIALLLAMIVAFGMRRR